MSRVSEMRCSRCQKAHAGRHLQPGWFAGRLYPGVEEDRAGTLICPDCLAAQGITLHRPPGPRQSTMRVNGQ